MYQTEHVNEISIFSNIEHNSQNRLIFYRINAVFQNSAIEITLTRMNVTSSQKHECSQIYIPSYETESI